MTITSVASQDRGEVLADLSALSRVGTRSRISRRVACDLVGFADALAVVAAVVVATEVCERGSVGMATLQLGLIAAVLVGAVMRNAGLYDIARLHRLPIEPSVLITAVAIGQTTVFGLLRTATAAGGAPRFEWFALALLGSFGLLLAVRFAARALLARLGAGGAFDVRVAVYGSGIVADRVQSHFSDPALGIRFVGHYDDRGDPGRQGQGGVVPTGRLVDLVAAGRQKAIDQIVISLPSTAAERTHHIVRQLEHLPVRISVVTHIASDLLEAGPAHRVSSLGPVGLMTVKMKPLSGWGSIQKATEDFVLGGLLMVVALPILAVVAVAVRLDSPGPVFFRQRRKGLNQQVFEVLKFRTMRVMEDGPSVRQATKGDPRITRVGRFLRRSSLDELPQLVNVLRGEMSLVGPRPHALAHDEHFGDLLARYPNRHQVKPGITGLAQVKGLRGETETTDKMEARLVEDLAYVESWSLGLDMKILMMTGVQVLGGRNAR